MHFKKMQKKISILGGGYADRRHPSGAFPL